MKQVISMMVAVLCLVAGTARAYEMDDKVGAEIVKISAGDQGVYGAAKWLREQNLLPVKADGEKMGVAEAYVKMCLKNFDTLRECETASLKLQPGQTLKVFAPIVARATYNERLTKPLEAEIAAKDQQIADLEAQNSELKKTLDGVSAEFRKSAVAISKLRVARDEALSKAAEFGEVVNRLSVAFYSSVQQNANLLAQLTAERQALNAPLKRDMFDDWLGNPFTTIALAIIVALLSLIPFLGRSGRMPVESPAEAQKEPRPDVLAVKSDETEDGLTPGEIIYVDSPCRKGVRYAYIVVGPELKKEYRGKIINYYRLECAICLSEGFGAIIHSAPPKNRIDHAMTHDARFHEQERQRASEEVEHQIH